MLASLERAQEAEHRFVGDASHELRTPLTALRGNAAYLAKHGPDDARRSPTSQDGAERLCELLDDLLALAREDAARAAPGRAGAARRPRRRTPVIEHDAWVEGEREALAARRRQPRPQRAQARHAAPSP